MPETSARSDENLPMPVFELVAILVAMTSVVALAIDMMLPALDDIAADLGAANPNDQQYVVTAYLAGFGAAQLLYGPLADRFGRKPVIMGALGLFLLTSLVCTLAPSFELFLGARVLQGSAAAACRVIAVAIARDLTQGRRMAEIMSMVMTAFMAVPVLAPGLGQLILTFAPWRWIFIVLILFGAALMLWLHFRLPETLHPEHRAPLRWKAVLASFMETGRHRLMVGYTIAATPFFGGLYAFLGTSQQIFVDHFALSDDTFPLVFAIIAGGIGFTSYANSRLVQRIGQRRLSHGALIAFCGISLVHALVLWSGVDNLILFIALLAASMAFLGLIAANFSALAMEPVGHVAGTASATYGFFSGVVGALIGTLVGQMYDGSALPLIASQAVLGMLALAAVFVTERGVLFAVTEDAR
jgi:DHA1 family bicyclomycin/chloramphenicol resistance-like MFS transporter